DDGKYARKFHVTRYPEVIYVSPEGVKSRYGLTLGSVMALKLRIQEMANVMKNYQ
ncbi:MAG: hypothetical protein GY793_11175, partial [Proteobacteria bacterium]|nr:hypothetical protein [Pseudomonadota bacterium]